MKVDENKEKKIVERLRRNWINSLEMYVNKQKKIGFIKKIANDIYSNISAGNPKVDDVFYASVEYFVEMEFSKKKLTKQKIKQDIDKILEVLKKGSEGVVTELRSIG